MKKFALAFLALFCAVSFTAKSEEVKLNEKPLAEVKKEIADGKAVLIDVREKGEWDEGHLKDAKLVPLSALKAEQKASADLPKDKTIYLHCKMNGRSKIAAGILQKQGFNAVPLKEGFDDLSTNGFEKAK